MVIMHLMLHYTHGFGGHYEDRPILVLAVL